MHLVSHRQRSGLCHRQAQSLSLPFGMQNSTILVPLGKKKPCWFQHTFQQQNIIMVLRDLLKSLISRGRSFLALGLKWFLCWHLPDDCKGLTAVKPLVGLTWHPWKLAPTNVCAARYWWLEKATICRASPRLCLRHIISARFPKARSFSSTSLSLSFWKRTCRQSSNQGTSCPWELAQQTTICLFYHLKTQHWNSNVFLLK